MPVSKERLLQQLPPYKDEWYKVKEKQHVKDIINLIIKQHGNFCNDYDAIADSFIDKDIFSTCEALQSFCVANLKYREEPEEVQTVGNPASILARSETGVDCKSYALFIGGNLDAICRRTGQEINWYYCFASYDVLQKIPYHVFVVVETDNGLLYVDPTPGSENKEPVWIINRRVTGKGTKGLVNGNRTVGAADTSQAGNGLLMPAPAWYPAYLPKFYNNNGDIRLLPLNAVPNYTENDVLDTCLYYQTLIGYNRVDWQNARSAAWQYTDGTGGARIWVQSAFKTDGAGNGSGNFAAISSNKQSIDGAWYSKLQARYIVNEKKAKPWLSSMQAKGGGIDLLTIPMGNDIEVPRPAWYAAHLPSLFFSAGNPGQYPAGHLDTKPKIRDGVSSGWAQYTIQPIDVAMYMLYAQPVIYSGATPYPLNWYINDDVNGAMASYFKITTGFTPGHTNQQMQTWGFTGNILQQPMLDANPFASGFTTTLQSIVSFAINYFAGKIPGGAKAVQAAYTAGSIGGGELITGGPVPPGVFSAAVFAAADALNTKITKDAQVKNFLIFGLLAAAVLGWYYQDEIKKEFSF